MTEHESWCCRSPQSPCALEGGCSGSCNCGADESIEDACRPVTLPSSETIRVRSSEPLNAEETVMLGEVVEAARRKMAAEHPANPAAEALWARLTARCDASGIRLHAAAREAGVRFSTLFRVGQGITPDSDELAAIEAWLTNGDNDA